ncbi:MAG: hypothetical protein U0Q21_04140 [Dermatophilaceae bacterium]
MARSAALTAEFTVQFGAVTGRVILLLIVVVPVMGILWFVRDQLVEKEVRRLQRLAGLPDPGIDRPRLIARMRVRQSGRVLGLAAMLAVGGLVAAWRGEIPAPWIAIVMPVAAALGTGLGHLRPGSAGARPRLAHLRPRELTDYVTPGELTIARGAGALAAVAPVVLIVGAVAGSPSVRAVVLAGLGMVAIAGAVLLMRRTLGDNLARPVELGTPTGLAWEEVVRAQTLRDLLGCAALAASGGGAGVLVTTSGVSAGWPEWFVVAAYGLLIVAFLVIAALLVAGLADQHFGWVREHALAGVHA